MLPDTQRCRGDVVAGNCPYNSGHESFCNDGCGNHFCNWDDSYLSDGQLHEMKKVVGAMYPYGGGFVDYHETNSVVPFRDEGAN